MGVTLQSIRQAGEGKVWDVENITYKKGFRKKQDNTKKKRWQQRTAGYRGGRSTQIVYLSKVEVPECRNTLLEIKVLQSKCYSSKSTK